MWGVSRDCERIRKDSISDCQGSPVARRVIILTMNSVYLYISDKVATHDSVFLYILGKVPTYICVFISYVQDLFQSISDKVAMYISVFLYTYLRQRTCLLFICLIWRSIIFEIKAINICMCNIWDREHTYHLYFMFQIDFWFSCGPQISKYLQEIQFQK